MKLTTRDKRALWIGGVGLAVLLVVRGVAIPWIDRWSDARAQAASASAELDALGGRMTRVLSRHADLSKRYGQGVFRPLADVETAQRDLLTAARDVLNKSKLGQLEYFPQKARPLRDVPGATRVAVQVKAKCKLDQLTKCLKGLSATPTLVMLDSLAVDNDAKKPGQLTVTLMFAAVAETAGGRS